VSGSESSIAFYRNSTRSATIAGDQWVLGHAAHNAVAGEFTIGCNLTAGIIRIQPSGATIFNYGVSAPSMTVQGSSVLTTASSILIANVTNLQSSLDGKANLTGGTFSGLINVPSLSCVLPAANGASELVYHKNSDKSGVSEPGAIWAVGRNAHSAGSNSFAIGANVIGSVLSVSQAGDVTIPYGLTVNGPIRSSAGDIRPWVLGRINSGAASMTFQNGAVTATAVQATDAGAVVPGRYNLTWPTTGLATSYVQLTTAAPFDGPRFVNYTSLTATGMTIHCYDRLGARVFTDINVRVDVAG
jgi:hypothetical protein